MTSVGAIYEENGSINLTARLGDYGPSYTRRFKSRSELLMELLSLHSVTQEEVLKICRQETLVELPGQTKEWAQVLLHGLNETTFSIRFTVFYEAQGPVLACCLAGPFIPATFSSKVGTRYESAEHLMNALDSVGLPGKKIAGLRRVFHDVYLVTGAQLRLLHLRAPDTQ
jgi:hypothetical protein